MSSKSISPEQKAARESLERAIEQKCQQSASKQFDPWHGGGRILRRPEVEVRTGLSRSTIYAMMDEGTFPRPIRLGKRAVGWRDKIIDEFLLSRTQVGEG